MNRKQAIGVAVIIASTALFGMLLTASIPLWLSVALIYPPATNRITNTVMKRMSREMAKFMFRGRFSPLGKGT